MNLANLSKLSSNEILEGSFGIEWESLRAKDDGKLYRFDKTWISFFDDATTEHSGLMTKTDK